MPNHKTHLWFDTYCLGLPYGKYAFVHKLMDSYAPLFARKHRRFLHNQATVQWFHQAFGPEAAIVARYHIELDRVMTFGNERKRR